MHFTHDDLVNVPLGLQKRLPIVLQFEGTPSPANPTLTPVVFRSPTPTQSASLSGGPQNACGHNFKHPVGADGDLLLTLQ